MSRPDSDRDDKRTGGLERVPPVLFFDLDNTLVDHSGALEHGLRDVVERWPAIAAGRRFADVLAAFERINDALWEVYASGAITSQDVRLQRFAQWFGDLGVVSDGGAVPTVPDASAYYMERYAGSARAYPGVLRMLEHLAERHEIGIITNGFVSAQSLKLGGSGLGNLIRHRIFSEEVGVQKPDPLIFMSALAVAGVGPEDALYVGDNFANDIAGAAGAGIATVWYNPNDDDHPHDRPEVTPNAVVRTIEQLAELLGVPR